MSAGKNENRSGHGATGAYWDERYARGRCAFLHEEREKPRFLALAELIAGIISRRGPCELADLGCGEGILLPYIEKLDLTHYIALDISSLALQAIRPPPFPMSLVTSSLGGWDGSPRPVHARIMVASEVLYYELSALDNLLAIAAAQELTTDLIVSCLAPRPDKPNWREGSERLWQTLQQHGLSAERTLVVRDEESGTAWDIAHYCLRP